VLTCLRGGGSQRRGEADMCLAGGWEEDGGGGGLALHDRGSRGARRRVGSGEGMHESTVHTRASVSYTGF
jgi:hypothetical protein